MRHVIPEGREHPHSDADLADVIALAAAWHRRIAEIAEDMYQHLASRIPVAAADPAIAQLTRASCTSNIESALSMLRSGIPASAAEAPVTALEHARAMAQRGADIDATLRFYRLGQGYFLQRWTADLSDAIDDQQRLLVALNQTAAFMVEYIDIVSSRVSAEHLAERERRQRRAAVLRADVIRALLNEDVVDVDVAGAERALAHRLDRPQLAFVCWCSGDPAQLERAAGSIADALGADRPLLLPDGPFSLGGWVSPASGMTVDRDALDRAVAASGPDVAAAFGTLAGGVEGFRGSRRQADRARRIAELAGTRVARCVHFDDVALLDLLSRDLDAARAFVRDELGGLGAHEPAIRTIRQTTLAVLTPRGGIAAAARDLHLHRNTVLQRLHRAAALRGRPIDERPAELHAALLLAEHVVPSAQTAP